MFEIQLASAATKIAYVHATLPSLQHYFIQGAMIRKFIFELYYVHALPNIHIEVL